MSTEREQVTLTRDCEAIVVPYGSKMSLPKGSIVTITQDLGGSFTVTNETGYLLKISDLDADALGKTATSQKSEVPPPTSQEEVEKQVMDALRTCFDPEIPFNIVDLGLIYLCKVTPSPSNGYAVEIEMTLTAPGCGMGDSLREDVDRKVRAVSGVTQAEIRMVLEPPWDESRMSDAVKLQLGRI